MSPLLTLAITLIAVVLAAGCWATMSAVMFGRFDNHRADTWFGSESWDRKYLLGSGGPIGIDWYRGIDLHGYTNKAKLGKSPVFVFGKWYYELFKIKYVERFPLSTTALVFVTDLYHLAQWFAIKFICIAIAVNTPAPVVYFFLCWLVWTVGFQVVYLNIKK